MVTVRDIEIEYRQRGSGPDIVWGHGLSSSMDDEDVLPLVDWSRIAEGWRLLRYDARGHGSSSSTEPPHDYSWANLARDQLALTDALRIDRYVAAGASMGAATALHAAVQAPERIVALVLVIPPTAWATRAAQTGNYAVMADLIAAGRHAELLAGARTVPPPDPLADEPVWTERFEHKLATIDPVRLSRVFRGAGTADLPTEHDIASIDVPTLILGWTADPTHPLTIAARLQELMPHTEVGLATTRDGLSSWGARVDEFLNRVRTRTTR
jgi:3-oxoadipate enol-lactonase